MSWYRDSSSGRAETINPYRSGPAKRQRTMQHGDRSSSNNNNNNNNNNNPHHNRVVLLFDMDCFYAQCERVRLGLPLDVELSLFQWNSVLAVTYPAREHGIKRGDSWDEVAAKTKAGKHKNNSNTSGNTNGTKNKNDTVSYTIHLPILGHAADDDPNESNGNDDKTDNDDSIEASFRRIYEVSREEQLRCQKTENGARRFHHQGKACLERYRLASMRIFAVVLESLQKQIRGYKFNMERASIDEFYLDLTDYCYRRNQNKENGNGDGKDDGNGDGNGPNDDDDHDHEDLLVTSDNTVVAGKKSRENGSTDKGSTDDPLEIALNRACVVSHRIRHDIWKILGFTMSAGISTNKTMAKLAALYGKPNGQAVLYPNLFSNILADTKITKVRNFGGKLGKTVLKLMYKYQQKDRPWNGTTIDEIDGDVLDRLKSTATMIDLQQIPLPFLLQSKSLSNESAQFVFSACRGIDHEEVKETSGALVKSITAFKSFAATKSHAEIFDRWLCLLANEIVERVARDTARNERYPKSCTLNYTYYTTPDGNRPSAVKGSTRSLRVSRSLRLRYPSEREGTKEHNIASLLIQAKAKLIPIVKDHPLRGVGLSVSNFMVSSQANHQAPEGTASIQSFFATKNSAMHSSPCAVDTPGTTTEDREGLVADKATSAMEFSRNNKRVDATSDRTNETTITTKGTHSECSRTGFYPLVSSSHDDHIPLTASTSAATSRDLQFSRSVIPTSGRQNWPTPIKSDTETCKDLDYARKLQASFDRENYVLSTANRRQKSAVNDKKTQRIDAFFKKR